jgi:hypothetical protein
MTRENRQERLVIVAVTESVTPALANRNAVDYLSPPQAPEQARSLVQLLTGTDPARNGPWTIPVPGGTRTVTIR